ncbi:site-specific integrase [Sulfoacidibacillus ferrooxidans]|uniref:Tyrosine recombinase XerD n=1 Tax=Sulfoacidibacillus ferrooxidans TaxID=2005001 RepID=A0A9X1VCB2_9BACL|nr:site-specific integrase [Sulfoacidibacillus ferrooxidans]MCI0183412.1 Tyrosine recombinase XerD [Sulfoacidibacillus ferrooxidans]
MEFVEPIREKRQIDAIKKILRSNNLRDYTLFVMGINSGLRVGDLISLSICDVLDNSHKIKDRIAIKEMKTGKSKNFPLSSNCKKAISEYLNSRSYNLNEPLFISRKKNQSLQRAQVWRIINGAARDVGIMDNIGTHTLRKTFAYHAYKSGIDITLIQRLLNHSSTSITLRYIGITRDQLDDVYLKLDL